MTATQTRPVPGVAVDRCIWIDAGHAWQRCPNPSVAVWTIGTIPIAGTCQLHTSDPRLAQTLDRLGAAPHPWDGASAPVER
jgi:hypothetical protein